MRKIGVLIFGMLALTSTFVKAQSEEESVIPVAIIGSGCAGLTAATVTREYGYDTVIFSGDKLGGGLNVKTEVGNWPGISFSQGYQIMRDIIYQVEDRGAKFINETVVDVDLSSMPYKIAGASGKTYWAHKILVATVTKERMLTVPGAKENTDKILYNWDIHQDMKGYKNKCNKKVVAVLGGGVDASKKAYYAEDAGAKEVNIFIRGEDLSVSPMRKWIIDNLCENIQVQQKHDLSHIERIGDRLRLHFKSDESMIYYDVDVLVVSIGRVPLSNFLGDQVEKNEKGYIVVDAKTQRTNVRGVYAAGDVTDACGVAPQASIAAGNGMIAGYEIVEELKAEAHVQKQFEMPMSMVGMLGKVLWRKVTGYFV